MIMAKVIEQIFIFCSAALIMGIALTIISRFIPVYNTYGISFIILSIAVLGAILYAFVKAPDKRRAALRADSFGLQERIVTAYELMGKNDDISILEKQDAIVYLKKVNVIKSISLIPKGKYIISFISILILFVIVNAMPNPMQEKAIEIHRHKVKITETQKKVEDVIKEVNKNPKLTQEQKKDVVAKLKELKKELNTANSEKELNKFIQKSEKKIELVKQKYINDDLEHVADILEKNESTKQLGEMLKKGDAKVIKKSLDAFYKELKTMTPSKLKELAQGFNQLAEELKNNPELKEAFLELASKIDDGELGDIKGNLDQISKELEELMYDPALTDALAKVEKELNDMQTVKQNSTDGSQMGNQQAQSQNTNKSSGQQGNQSGNGQGNNGGGAGNGSDKGSENQGPVGEAHKTGIGKKGGSAKEVADYEKIFTPKNLGGEGQTSILNGKKGQGGDTDRVITDQSPAIRGENIPYNQVFGEYKQSAMESIEGSAIPAGMKELVKNYFTTLEE